MIAVDTNVIVRLLTQDDLAQYKKAYRLFQTESIFIADSVILETEWVLRYAYKFNTSEICTSFRKLFGLSNIHIKDAQALFQILELHEQGIDFADAMHLINAQPYDALYTFDKKFIAKSAAFTNLNVKIPN